MLQTLNMHHFSIAAPERCAKIACMNTVSWQTPLSSQELSPLLQSDDLPLAAPTANAWGYYIDIGQGMGYFSWFPEQSHMLRHLGHVEVLHLPSLMPERADYEALVDQLIPILKNYAQTCDAAPTEAAHTLVHQYQHVLPDLKLRWVGPLTALSTEQSPFAQEVRQAFHTQTGETVSQAEEALWWSFLADYGM